MKIYILSPYLGSGGPRALHALSSACMQLGFDAYLCYYFENSNNINTVFPEFESFNIKIVKKEEIEQTPENWIVFPEFGPWAQTIELFKNMRRAYWWLSVDNNYGRFMAWNDASILHLYQTTYSLTHILNNNGKMYLPLIDIIHDDFFKIEKIKKDNVICFNPTKDKLTPTIKHLFNYETMPLFNLSRINMIKSLQRSKIYVDFGYHPGMESIPREASILDNIIITNRRGSAYFFSDVPSMDRYKFKDTDIDNIVTAVNDCMIYYDERIKDFQIYRNIIKNQKSIFYKQIEQIFTNNF